MEKFTTKYRAETPIRALSWKQPYLDLMLHGKIETRTWATNYRGWVLMCASKKDYNQTKILEISGFQQYDRIGEFLYKDINITDNSFLTDQALAIGRLVDCRPMLPGDEEKTFVQYRAPWEEVVKRKKWVYNENSNTYSYKTIEVMVNKKLYCHIYEDVQAIEPFGWSGSQGWKTLTASERSLIILK